MARERFRFGLVPRLDFLQSVPFSVDLVSWIRLQVLVVPCPADKEMLWKQLPTGQIQNKASGKCLDAPQPGQKYADGSALPPHMLTESECDSTRATQQWEPIEAPMVSISE
mmetsp:Transcript_88739/g.255936  ORF Transcript_88739/g.255936 Transcript_88739/m.255936 type:complete len:111 (+) Transcript_88739:799-1131(+)